MSHEKASATVTGSALRLVGIQKRFGEVTAVARGDLEVALGELHAVVGENGAGKSTLLGVAAGIVSRDAGELWVFGERQASRDGRTVRDLGVAMVQQHFSLFDDLSVLDNLFVGVERTNSFGRIDVEAEVRRARDVLAELGFSLPLDARVATLGVGDRQRLEIARALCRDARIIILDEPTALLTPGEAEALYRTLAGCVARGRGVVVVTHKLDEVRAHADRVTVMRRGETIVSRAMTVHDDVASLAGEIVGGEPPPSLSRARRDLGPVALRVRALSSGRALRAASFEVRAREIVGVAGVLGNGQSELVLALAGLLRPDDGEIEAGRVAVVHEDRHSLGLVLDASIAENLVLGELPRFAPCLTVSEHALRSSAIERISRFDIRPPDPRAIVRTLSGGNQQKIVVARAIARKPDVLVIAHATRGVDVVAARSIHEHVLEAATAGAAVLLVSADLAELRALCDRILVMSRGTVVASLPPEVDDATLGRWMLSGDGE